MHMYFHVCIYTCCTLYIIHVHVHVVPCKVEGQIVNSRNVSIRKGREPGNEATPAYMYLHIQCTYLALPSVPAYIHVHCIRAMTISLKLSCNIICHHLLPPPSAQLLKMNADVDCANEHGNTPLHYASFWNFIGICEVCAHISLCHVSCYCSHKLIVISFTK